MVGFDGFDGENSKEDGYVSFGELRPPSYILIMGTSFVELHPRSEKENICTVWTPFNESYLPIEYHTCRARLGPPSGTFRLTIKKGSGDFWIGLAWGYHEELFKSADKSRELGSAKGSCRLYRHRH